MNIKITCVLLGGLLALPHFTKAGCNYADASKWTYLGKFTITNYTVANENGFLPITAPDYLYTPTGLDREFSHAFMDDVDMQGTGVTADGKYVKLLSTLTEQKNHIWRYGYVPKIIGKAGTELTDGYSVAVDTAVISLGTILCIDGYGERLAEDTGSRITGNHIDLFRLVTRAQALQFGTKSNIDVSKKNTN
ncbi:3D domain-containing protein [Pontiellaceae bacterium B1224]|nr:3D domain-containing protein [Pontiellaceae bacterium B1224]